MKREDVLAMDLDELNLAIAGSIFKAKVIGNDDDPEERLLIGWYGEEGWKPLSGARWQSAIWRHGDEEAWLDCPRFAEDISAAWEMEELFKGEVGFRASYVARLKEVLGSNAWMFDFVHATPEQRCKAALLAVLEDINLPGEETTNDNKQENTNQ